VNGLDPRDARATGEAGFLRRARYATARTGPAAGGELFRFECSSCHTVNGVRGLKRIVKGWDVETMDHQLGRLEKLQGVMPPFAGSESERRALARWLGSLNAPPKASP
jgi:mono/diheme cytochrome c family protein